MTDAELAVEKRLAHEKAAGSELRGSGSGSGAGSRTAVNPATVALAWMAVALPLGWGIYRTLLSVAKFFH